MIILQARTNLRKEDIEEQEQKIREKINSQEDKKKSKPFWWNR